MILILVFRWPWILLLDLLHIFFWSIYENCWIINSLASFNRSRQFMRWNPNVDEKVPLKSLKLSTDLVDLHRCKNCDILTTTAKWLLLGEYTQREKATSLKILKNIPMCKIIIIYCIPLINFAFTFLGIQCLVVVKNLS